MPWARPCSSQGGQDQVEPAVGAEANAPHEVAVTLPEVFADEAGGQRGQGIEVEGAAPAAGGEAVEQVADHPRAREQQLVGGVVHSAPSRSAGRQHDICRHALDSICV